MDVIPLERLRIREYNAAECTAAIRGERLPHALGFPVVRLCVIRGIRYHLGFAEELRGTLPEFTRALNARNIMSNIIPALTHPDEVPYCIWHPDVANETTYRELAQRYPNMVYHVARACAVAGYTDLYLELGVLPEVHIAEEARDNGSKAIFDAIMASPIKYTVMDDYTRTVDIEHPRPAHLNGDTAVRSSLVIKQKHRKPVGLHASKHSADSDSEDFDDVDDWFNSTPGYNTRHYFNITEDYGIDEHDSSKSAPDYEEDVAPLLYSPLPADLPPVKKDILILMAAYYGDIDRYTRLRRPKMIDKELNCVIRGIYQNTLFAKWWSMQSVNYDRIRCAVNARFIMSNDLSRMTADTPLTDIPYCIWFPSRASWHTYQELARRKPGMKPQIARACIVADYQSLFDKLDVMPDAFLIAEARTSPNPHYLRCLERKVAEQGLEIKSPRFDGWKLITRKDLFEPPMSSTAVFRDVDTDMVGTGFPFIYDGVSADVGSLELSVCARDTLEPGQDSMDLDEVYPLAEDTTD